MAPNKECSKKQKDYNGQPHRIPLALWLILLLILALTAFVISRLDPSSSDFKDWVLVVLTGVLGALTAAYVVVSALQWSAVTHSVSLSRQTAERQLRAYVGLEGIKLHIPDAASIPIAYVGIKNYGLTPARKVIHLTEMVIANIVDPDLPALKMPAPSGLSTFVVSPAGHQASKKVVLLNAQGDQRTLMDDELRALRVRNPQVALHVYGVISYQDVFGNRRTTTYRMMHFGRNFFGRGMNMLFCGDGNDCD